MRPSSLSPLVRRSGLSSLTSRCPSLSRARNRFYIVGPNGEKVHVQGNLTNGEDIGDSGLRVAWNAWKTSLASSSSAAEEDAKVELRLPGLQEFTDDQLFFLAFGRIWASASTPAAAKVPLPSPCVPPSLPHALTPPPRLSLSLFLSPIPSPTSRRPAS